MEFLTDPMTQTVLWTIIGIAVKTFCPAAVPFLGVGKKLVNELTQLHEESKVDNHLIVNHAADSNLKVAKKFLERKLEK